MGFAIASADVSDTATSSNNDTSLLSSTDGVHLKYSHTPPKLHFQLRLLTRDLPSQYSVVATLPSSSSSASPPPPPSASSFHKAMWEVFRLQYRGRALSEDEANAVRRGSGGGSHSVTLAPTTGIMTNFGIEITRSSQETPWYSQVPLPFVFVLAAPGVEAVSLNEKEVK